MKHRKKPYPQADFKPFRWRMIAFLVLFLCSTTTIGYLLFKDLSTLINSTLERSKPSYRLFVLKDLSGELKNAENMVSMYSIHQNDEVLYQYYRQVESLQAKLDSAESLQSNDNELPIDSIRSWIGTLLVNWDQTIRLESSLSVSVALDNLLNKMKDSQKNKVNSQKNILKNLFKKRQQASKDESLMSTLNTLEQQEAQQTLIKQQKRLQLFKESNKLLTQINDAIEKVTLIEIERLSQATALAAKQSEEIKTKGKATIEVISNPLGKSGSSLVLQSLILFYGSLMDALPMIALYFGMTCIVWIYVANEIGKTHDAVR